MRVAVASAAFTRDLDFCVLRAGALVDQARERGADLLVLPHGTLGGYVDDLDADGETPPDLPPALALDDPHLGALATRAGALTLVLGFTERAPSGGRYDTAVCVHGDGVLGVHRKVHLPAGEIRWYEPGAHLAAFDTPVGRLGMLVDYDKTFPEAARALALDGAELIAVPSAWPMSLTHPADRIAQDRQSVLFDLYDRSRAAENQVVVASANLVGQQGRLRFIGQSKVVLPDGRIVAATGYRAGLAVADVDPALVVAEARRRHHHLVERRPAVYGAPSVVGPGTPS